MYKIGLNNMKVWHFTLGANEPCPPDPVVNILCVCAIIINHLHICFFFLLYID